MSTPLPATLLDQVLLRRLMDTIPTSKEGVWSYSIRWDAYDKATMGPKFSNWIGQKVRHPSSVCALE